MAILSAGLQNFRHNSPYSVVGISIEGNKHLKPLTAMTMSFVRRIALCEKSVQPSSVFNRSNHLGKGVATFMEGSLAATSRFRVNKTVGRWDNAAQDSLS